MSVMTHRNVEHLQNAESSRRQRFGRGRRALFHLPPSSRPLASTFNLPECIIVTYEHFVIHRHLMPLPSPLQYMHLFCCRGCDASRPSSLQQAAARPARFTLLSFSNSQTPLYCVSCCFQDRLNSLQWRSRVMAKKKMPKGPQKIRRKNHAKGRAARSIAASARHVLLVVVCIVNNRGIQPEYRLK